MAELSKSSLRSLPVVAKHSKIATPNSSWRLHDDAWCYQSSIYDTVDRCWKNVKLALMLVLVKCYDNKMVKATPHLFHPFFDST